MRYFFEMGTRTVGANYAQVRIKLERQRRERARKKKTQGNPFAWSFDISQKVCIWPVWWH